MSFFLGNGEMSWTGVKERIVGKDVDESESWKDGNIGKNLSRGPTLNFFYIIIIIFWFFYFLKLHLFCVLERIK